MALIGRRWIPVALCLHPAQADAASWSVVLPRLAYLAATNTFVLLRLLPMSDRDKDIGILALRHQLPVLQRRAAKPVFTDADRAILAGLLHHPPSTNCGASCCRSARTRSRGGTPTCSSGTTLRPACRSAAGAHPPTVRPIRTPVPRPARENTSWGHRRIHGEPAALGIKVAASTVREILREHGIPPAPERQSTARADLPSSQAGALLARDLFETRTPTGTGSYVFAVLEHATRRIRVLGATAHPTADRIIQLGRNLLRDLEDSAAGPGSRSATATRSTPPPSTP